MCYVIIRMLMYRIEFQLNAIETSHQIAKRWTKDSQNYQATKNTMESRVKQELRQKMTSEARERWFLLRMKSKYAGTHVCVLYILLYHIVQLCVRGNIGN